MSNIFKNIVNGNSLTTATSPKNMIPVNGSIDRINKGINESISKGSNKEIQLI